MREIKFRVWKDYMPGFEYFSLKDMMFSKEDDLTRINQSSSSDYEQFTGLHDKSGKEIYEGDIRLAGVLVGDEWEEHMAYVRWDNEYAGFVWYMPYIDDDQLMDLGDCNVIGNIHENPELLK